MTPELRLNLVRAGPNLNDYLTVLLNALAMALRECPADHPAREHIMTALSAENRCESVVCGLVVAERQYVEDLRARRAG